MTVKEKKKESQRPPHWFKIDEIIIEGTQTCADLSMLCVRIYIYVKCVCVMSEQNKYYKYQGKKTYTVVASLALAEDLIVGLARMSSASIGIQNGLVSKWKWKWK